MKPSPKLLIYLAVALSSTFSSCVSADEEIAEEELRNMTAVFVNEHPREEIELFWVNHDLEDDDTDRLVRSA